jgi:hypothetical protein
MPQKKKILSRVFNPLQSPKINFGPHYCFKR